MAHNIYISNLSNHDQTFEVHGWNDNKNLTINGGKTAIIRAPDHSSGAIIALHDGHEGEQAEITKGGANNNDFFDISWIVGAGGNLTIQQVGDPSTLKGDAEFMQQLNQAWAKADAGKKASLKNCVHLDGSGRVVRIDAIKDNPPLEPFVRSFANGKGYIGTGSWNGNPGNSSDNNQSSAAHGNKDIQVTYSDGNAAPRRNMPAPAEHFAAPQQKLVQQESVNPPQPAGPGILLSNKSNKEQTYAFYNNYWNGNGTAGANFDHPDPTVSIPAHTTKFVPLPKTFKGRVQRGTQLPATWAEFQIAAANDGHAHGDISLEQGCDGAATIASTDGTNRVNGFNFDILAGAPPAAVTKKPDGEKALATTVGNWTGGPNQAAIEYERRVVGQKRAYITGGTGTDDVGSANNCLAVDFY